MSPRERIRPTTEVSVAVLDSVDSMYARLRARLEGLTDEEYRWEPVDGMWSVRRRDDGSVTVDGAGEYELDPAPVTTIAWRLWHLSVDCFDDYTDRLIGSGRELPPADWVLGADDAVAALDTSWTRYRSVIAGRERWWDELGVSWGPWHEHSIVDMALHAGNELVHHGAEIALLRDLYRARSDR